MSSLIRVCLATAALACAGPPSTADLPMVFVGEVADGDGDTSIAVAIARDRVVAYTCSDDPVSDDYGGWLAGGLAPDQSQVRIERAPWSFEAWWDDHEATGTLVRADGTTYPWLARPVTAGHLDGLYLKKGRECMTAVIVDGATVRGAWWCDSGEIAQVTPLFPLELVDGRLPVEVRHEAETYRVEVSPVRSPLP